MRTTALTMSELLCALINASEKAANIARMIKKEDELLNLLIQEKDETEKNERFVQDFKTLADVLIQESVKHDIGKMFPEMQNDIYGEENNTFTNQIGETVTVEIKETVEETRDLLSHSLNGRTLAATLLANELHSDVKVICEPGTSHVPKNILEGHEKIGLWIDPIDSTNEYIESSNVTEDESQQFDQTERICGGGLACVTVLIGAFDLVSGEPLMGIINQPFWKFSRTDLTWTGRYFWGVQSNSQYFSSLMKFPMMEPKKQPVILLSRAESTEIKMKLQNEFCIMYSAGAGYKLLCLALGLADVYLLTKGTTFYWDTCAPHAILKSLGGNIVKCSPNVKRSQFPERSVHPKQLLTHELSYVPNEEGFNSHFSHFEGVIAYKDHEMANQVCRLLRPS